MGDNDGSLAAHRLVGEPRRNATHKVTYGLAAMRRGGGIAQPGIGGIRFVRNDLAKRFSGPPPVVTFAKHRLDLRAQFKCLSGLTGPQFGAGPTAIDARQASDKPLCYAPTQC